MVPAGDPTEETITRLAEMLEADGIIIDGGNSNLKNSVPRAAKLKERACTLPECAFIHELPF